MSIHVRVRKRPDRQHLQLWYRCPLTGRIVTRSAETDNPREAERQAAQWEADLAHRRPVANPSWEAFRLRFEDEVLATKPRNTRLSYLGALNNWERHIGKVRALELITPSLISQFAAALGKEVAQTTVASNLRHLRAVFRWAELMELMNRAPRIAMPKISRRRLARSRAITQDEFRRIREAIQAVRPATEVEQWERLLDLLWLSGLRVGEALNLSWDSPPLQVDLDGGRYPRIVMFAEGQKSRDDLSSVIAPDFAEWLRQTPLGARRGPVLPGLGTLSRSTVSHVISECGTVAGVHTAATKPASAHDFRRAYGQRWAKIVKPLTLQKMMRHATLQTTLSYYVDMDDEDVGSDLYAKNSVQRHVQRSGSFSEPSRETSRKKRGKMQG